MKELENTCLSVDKKLWRTLLDKGSKELTKYCDLKNKDFVKKLNGMAEKVVLDVRNGVEEDPKLVEKVRNAGYVNEAFEYSRNLAKFAGDIFREKIHECGSRDACCCVDNPSLELRNDALNRTPDDGQEDFDVCIDANVLFHSNEEYEKYSTVYSVNTRTITQAEWHLERIINKSRFDVVKRIYLHPGEVIPESELSDLEKLKIKEARDELRRVDYKKLLRFYFISDKRVHERHEQLATYADSFNDACPFYFTGIVELQELAHKLTSETRPAERLICYEESAAVVGKVGEETTRKTELIESLRSNYHRICSEKFYPELYNDERLRLLRSL